MGLMQRMQLSVKGNFSGQFMDMKQKCEKVSRNSSLFSKQVLVPGCVYLSEN